MPRNTSTSGSVPRNKRLLQCIALYIIALVHGEDEAAARAKANFETIKQLGEIVNGLAKKQEEGIHEQAKAKRAPNNMIRTPGMNDDTLLELNAFTFGGNVLQKVGDANDNVAQWIVAFCPLWHQPCQNLLPVFAALGSEWEGKLNHGLLTKEVRFAKVDCASEKVLCNEQTIDAYPTVMYYSRGEPTAKWIGRGKDADVERLVKWVQKRVGGVLGSTATADISGSREAIDSVAGGIWQRLYPGERMKDALLIVAALLLTLRSVLNNPALALQQAKQSSIAVNTYETIPRPSLICLLPQGWGRERRGVDL